MRVVGLFRRSQRPINADPARCLSLEVLSCVRHNMCSPPSSPMVRIVATTRPAQRATTTPTTAPGRKEMHQAQRATPPWGAQQALKPLRPTQTPADRAHPHVRRPGPLAGKLQTPRLINVSSAGRPWGRLARDCTAWGTTTEALLTPRIRVGTSPPAMGKDLPQCRAARPIAIRHEGGIRNKVGLSPCALRCSKLDSTKRPHARHFSAPRCKTPVFPPSAHAPVGSPHPATY